MFTKSCIHVSHTFIATGDITESTVKLIIKGTRSKIFGNAIFEKKDFTLPGLTLIYYSKFTTIKDDF